jgi:hypothetical protein
MVMLQISHMQINLQGSLTLATFAVKIAMIAAVSVLTLVPWAKNTIKIVSITCWIAQGGQT